MIKPGIRLKTIADCVDEGVILADIGSDHAILPCYLLQEKRIAYAYACDINEGPLLSAQRTMKEHGITENITTILSNGLENVPDDCEEIVISGMGFETIQMILENHLSKLQHYKKCIIQSNTDVEDLRKWISDHHYTITEEKIIKDGFYYQVVCFNTNESETLSEDEILFGKQMVEDELFYEMWNYKKSVIEHILKQLPDAQMIKKEEFSSLLKRIEKKLAR